MEPREALKKSYQIMRQVGYEPDELNCDNFLDYSKMVCYVVSQWNNTRAAKFPWLQDWAETWIRMQGEMNEIVARDPMVLYKPKNQASLDFHSSNAYIRHFQAGNRTSKTQSGYAEHYFHLTGWHPFRYIPEGAFQTFIVGGMGYTAYAEKTFLPKMITGEGGNPLSPIFPTNGKWFYNYDKKTYTLTLGCKDCAKKGKAQSCPSHHLKSSVKLFSPENGIKVIEGFTAILAHGDEHIPEEFFGAMMMRVADNPHASMIFTGTPLHGMEAWENRRLVAVAKGPKEKNLKNPNKPDSVPQVSWHHVSMADGGIVAEDEIELRRQQLDEFEFEARIMGLPSPMAKKPVFDRKALATMRRACSETPRYALILADEARNAGLEELSRTHEVLAVPEEGAPLRVWKEPKVGVHYLVSVDAASGLTAQDYSVVSVFAMDVYGSGLINLEMVAQHHGHTNPLDLGVEVKKLGVWYNYAPVAVETTGGHGAAVLLKLKELCYFNILGRPQNHDSTGGVTSAPTRLGIDTSIKTKPAMVAATQKMLSEGRVAIPCEDTIVEMTGYEQQEKSTNTIYKGSGKMHDDRTMSVILACYAVSTMPLVDLSQGLQESFKYADLQRRLQNGEITEDDAIEWETLYNNIALQEEENPFADW